MVQYRLIEYVCNAGKGNREEVTGSVVTEDDDTVGCSRVAGGEGVRLCGSMPQLTGKGV